MSGRYSRQKGYRNEIIVRDAIRAEGFTDCFRVPLSGAHISNKGDLEFLFNGIRVKVEVKSRKKEFQRVYEMMTNEAGIPCTQWAVHYEDGSLQGVQFVVATTIRAALECKEFFMRDQDTSKEENKAIRKVAKLRELLGECQVLAVKDDGHKPLYVVYHV